MFSINKTLLPDKSIAPRSDVPSVAFTYDMIETFENDIYRTFATLGDHGFIEWEAITPSQTASCRCHYSGMRVIGDDDDPTFAPRYDTLPELLSFQIHPA